MSYTKGIEERNVVRFKRTYRSWGRISIIISIIIVIIVAEKQDPAWRTLFNKK